MPILNKPFTELKPSPEEIAQQLKRQAVMQFNQLVGAYESGLRQFWKHPFATPYELAVALGPEGAELFQLHGIIRYIVLSVKPDQILTSPDDYGTFTFNPDGSIKILSIKEKE